MPFLRSSGRTEPGDHKIEISGSEFFESYTETVTVKQGEVASIEPRIILKKAQVTVKLGDEADGAEVFSTLSTEKRRPLNRIVEKGSPLILPVDGKRYELLATKKGYDDFEQPLEFSVAEPVKTVTVNMNEGSGESPAPVETSRYAGSEPATPSAPSPRPAAAAVSGTGTLNINSIPASSVLLDGRPLGITRQRLVSAFLLDRTRSPSFTRNMVVSRVALTSDRVASPLRRFAFHNLYQAPSPLRPVWVGHGRASTACEKRSSQSEQTHRS